MPGFETTPSSAVNISEKIIKLNEGETIVRVLKNYYVEANEHWISGTVDGKKQTRRFPCTGSGCYICKLAADMNNSDISMRVAYFSPAVVGQYIRVKVKDKKTGNIVQAKKVQFQEECGILKFGIGIYRKFNQIEKDPGYKEEGGITGRNVTIIKTKKGADVKNVSYDAIPFAKVSPLPAVENVDEVMAEIDAMAAMAIDIGAVNKLLGNIIPADEPAEDITIEDTGSEEAVEADEPVVEEAADESGEELTVDDEPATEEAAEDESLTIEDEELTIDDDPVPAPKAQPKKLVAAKPVAKPAAKIAAKPIKK